MAISLKVFEKSGGGGGEASGGGEPVGEGERERVRNVEK